MRASIAAPDGRLNTLTFIFTFCKVYELIYSVHQCPTKSCMRSPTTQSRMTNRERTAGSS